MAEAFREHFARIVALARTTLTEVKVSQEIDPRRAILSVEGEFSGHRIIVKEIIVGQSRWYSFYILTGSRVMLGLDNHPDREALCLKYGKDASAHLNDPIPHEHGPDKISVSLTEEWTVERFLSQLQDLVTKFTIS